jgi:hypothetical protein
MTAPAALTPTAGAFNLSVGTTSGRQVLPTTGSPTILALTNLSVGSGSLIYAVLGDVTSVAVVGQSLAITPGQTAYVTIGANTYIAAIATSSPAALNVTPST